MKDNEVIIPTPLSVILSNDLADKTYHDRIRIKYDYFINKIINNPALEYWDYVEHFNSSISSSTLTLELKRTKLYMVSTKGRLIRISDGKGIIVNPWETPQGYVDVNVKFDGDIGYSRVRLHRLVACSLIPPKPSLIPNMDVHVVDHKNRVRNCNEVTNLRWTDSLYNSTRDRSAYRVTWDVDDELRGTVFYFMSMTEAEAAGFNQAMVSNSCLGKCGVHLGCDFEPILKSDVVLSQLGVPEEIIRRIKIPGYVIPGTVPVIGTVIETGAQFSLYGKIDIELNGFDRRAISRNISGAFKQHKGCRFRYSNRTEAMKYQNGLLQ